jgi:hypothetical protein
MDRPVLRSGASNAEMDQWGAAFAAGISDKLYRQYLDDGEMTGASDSDKCAVSIAFYDAIAMQREETAARIYKTIMSDDDTAAPAVASLPTSRAGRS